MVIEYEIKGVKLSEEDLTCLHEYYEAARTAEYLMSVYDIKNEEKAMELGYYIRRLMDRFDYTESEAISEALNKEDEDDECDDEENTSFKDIASSSSKWKQNETGNCTEIFERRRAL